MQVSPLSYFFFEVSSSSSRVSFKYYLSMSPVISSRPCFTDFVTTSYDLIWLNALACGKKKVIISRCTKERLSAYIKTHARLLDRLADGKDWHSKDPLFRLVVMTENKGGESIQWDDTKTRLVLRRGCLLAILVVID